jgi:hypothetical protein
LVFSVFIKNERLVLYSSAVLIHSIVIQCNVNLTPNTDDLKETGWEGGNETDLAQDRGMAVSFKNGVEDSSFH